MNKIKIWFLKMCLNECVKDERDFCYRFFRFKLFKHSLPRMAQKIINKNGTLNIHIPNNKQFYSR